MIQQTIRVEQETWKAIVQKAKERKFQSTQSYVRHLFQEDLEGKNSIDDLEERIAASLGRIAGQVQSLGTMQQSSFALLSLLSEFLLRNIEDQAGSVDTQKRIDRFWELVSRDIRKNPKLKELTNAQTQTATA
jgi:hypothetical protein